MEAEEYEHIPWSNLVADTQPSIDRRLYLVGGGIAVIVILIFAFRMFGSAAPVGIAQPVTVSSPVTGSPVEANVPEAVAAPPEVVSSVTEADLMAAGADPSTERIDVAEFFAEWFVTDFYTRDGSSETLTSLRAVVSESIAAELPHGDPDASDAFVEWARAFHTEDHGATVDVSVAFRSVHAVDGGFVRDPVEAVTITLANVEDHWTVQALPKIAELP
jgi:hypothetical protein